MLRGWDGCRSEPVIEKLVGPMPEPWIILALIKRKEE